MQQYLQLISRTKYFLLPWLLFLAVAGIVLANFSVSEIHLAFNSRNNAALDFLMPWITLIADGWTIVVFCLLMFAWDRKAGLFISIACIIPSAIVQALKMTVFNGEPRPKWYFTHIDKIDLHYVPGVENWLYDSFPSGHTTVAFAFFFSLALCVPNRKFGMLFFMTALLVGYSRIYLSQHFLLDVFAGSIFGTITTLIVFAEASRWKWITLPVRTSENR
jgi:hypothetical protein